MEAGYGVRAFCDACGHRGKVDLIAVALKVGEDYPVSPESMRKVLKCSRCNRKSISISLYVEHTGPTWSGQDAKRQ